MLARNAVALLAVLPAVSVCAFKDSSPLVAWSSHSSALLDELSGQSVRTMSPIHDILSSSELCTYDAIVLADQPGLHSSDLRKLEPEAALSTYVASAPSSCQLPYVKRDAKLSMRDVTESIASRCGSQLVHMSSPDEGAFGQGKHVVYMGLSPLEGSVDSRKSSVAQTESMLSAVLDSVAAQFPKHLVIFSGSAPPLRSRQLDEDDYDLSDAFQDEDGFEIADVTMPLRAPVNATLPEGGIFKKYQLFTPALILILGIVLFVFVPVIMLGVTALSSIQSSLRLEAPQRYNAQEKKMQ